jgi:hypothetical protein
MVGVSGSVSGGVSSGAVSGGASGGVSGGGVRGGVRGDVSGGVSGVAMSQVSAVSVRCQSGVTVSQVPYNRAAFQKCARWKESRAACRIIFDSKR